MNTYRVQVELRDSDHKEAPARAISYEVSATPQSLGWNAFCKFRYVIAQNLGAYDLPHPDGVYVMRVVSAQEIEKPEAAL